jgi:two-component system, LytTR family, sensor kinase
MLPNSLPRRSLASILVANRWIWHVVFWILYITSRSRPYYITVLYYSKLYIEFMLVVDFTIIFIIYFTIWLFKKYFAQQRYALYFIFGLSLWLIYLVFVITMQKSHLQPIPEIARISWANLYLNNLSYYILQFILVTMAKYFKDNYFHQYYDNERLQQQMRSEIDNLKAQISPHFLFNTMNNFYGLAVEGSKKLPGLMVRLSDLLRYSLYETKNMTVPIANEIAYLKNYIELEKIRLEETLEFEFVSDIEGAEHYEIAPLLFVVFAENAFKHAKNVKDDVIKIKIHVSISDTGLLRFEIVNNYLVIDAQEGIPGKGIGLENVKKRLEVLYPNGSHELRIEKNDGYYSVNLKINLNTSI